MPCLLKRLGLNASPWLDSIAKIVEENLATDKLYTMRLFGLLGVSIVWLILPFLFIAYFPSVPITIVPYWCILFMLAISAYYFNAPKRKEEFLHPKRPNLLAINIFGAMVTFLLIARILLLIEAVYKFFDR